MKKSLSATVDERLITWIDAQLKKNPHFRNKSHVVELALEEFKKKAGK